MEQIVLVFQKELGPHLGAQPRDTGHVLVAAGGKALVLRRRGALDICVRDHMRHLRGEGDHLVVRLRRREGKARKARGLEQLLDVVEEQHIVKVRRHDDHRRAMVHGRLRVLEAGILRAGHRVAAEERDAVFLCDREARGADGALRAAAVEHDGVRSDVRGHAAKPLDGRLRVERDEHKIARGDVVLRELGVHRAAHYGKIEHAAAAVPGEHGRARFVIRLGKRTADQAQANDADRHFAITSRMLRTFLARSS